MLTLNGNPNANISPEELIEVFKYPEEREVTITVDDSQLSSEIQRRITELLPNVTIFPPISPDDY